MAEVKIGAATRPRRGYFENGDGYFTMQWDDMLFLALFDGLGHGRVAAVASDRCLSILKESYQTSLPVIFTASHNALRRTRGVVMGIALISLSTLLMRYAGVGNIATKVISGEKSTHLVSMDGIVGYTLPTIKEFTHQLIPGDVIVMHTDGISSSNLSLHPSEQLKDRDPQTIAEEILDNHAKSEDDATILIIHI